MLGNLIDEMNCKERAWKDIMICLSNKGLLWPLLASDKLPKYTVIFTCILF